MNKSNLTCLALSALYTCLFAFLFASASHAEERICFEKHLSDSTAIVGTVSSPEGFKDSPAENEQVSINATDAVICNKGGIIHYVVEICTDGKRSVLWEKKPSLPARVGFPEEWYQLIIYDVILNQETGQGIILYYKYSDLYVDIVQFDKEQNQCRVLTTQVVLPLPFQKPLSYGKLIYHEKVYILTDSKFRGLEIRKLNKGEVTLIYHERSSLKAERGKAERQKKASEEAQNLLDSMLYK